mmetsp:Transcript_13353/g.11851  ORF Transcript_13353/g.11851 Transcript_13353/m.11851 type:complete len:532 (+) Transcript_13353:19-1614(+)
MASVIERFEEELKSKISFKSSSFQSEEGFLVKQFKFFDIYNTATLSFDNFYRTIEKIGIIKDKEEIRDLYPHLAGVQQSREINYREYSKSLFSSKPLYEQPKSVGYTYSPSKHGASAEMEEGKSSHQILRSGVNSQDYPLSTTSHLYKPATSAGRKNVTYTSLGNPEANGYNEPLESLNKILDDVNYNGPKDLDVELPAQADPPIKYNYGHEPEYYKQNQYSLKNAPKSQVLYIERFKEELIQRGGRGLVGLLKQFKLFDTDQSGCLDKYEFKKAVDDYEINVHPKDLDNLFNSFDADGNSTIDYNEFLQAIAGALSKYRLQLVENVFDKLDQDREGSLDINDILSCFDPYRHPDVATGKNDPEGAFNDFKDTLEAYHNVVHDYNSSAKVSRNEFTDFYTFVSSQEDNDAQFDIMINGVWNLDNKNNYEEMPYAGSSVKITKVDPRSKWLSDHHRKMFSGEDAVFAKGDASWQTTHLSKYRTDIEAPSVTAGVPTWPIGAESNWNGGQTHEDQRADSHYNAPQHYAYGSYQ